MLTFPALQMYLPGHVQSSYSDISIILLLLLLLLLLLFTYNMQQQSYH